MTQLSKTSVRALKNALTEGLGVEEGLGGLGWEVGDGLGLGDGVVVTLERFLCCFDGDLI